MVYKKTIIFFLIITLFSLSIFLFLFKIGEKNKEKNLGFAQELNFPPQFPQRLISLAYEIEQMSDELDNVSKALNEAVAQCDCSKLQSRCYAKTLATQDLASFLTRQGINIPNWVSDLGYLLRINLNTCQPLPPLGDPCGEKREEIEEHQRVIRERLDRVRFLREILIKEKETSLKKELKTLLEDDAQALEEAINKLIDLTSNLENNFQGGLKPIGHQCKSQCPGGEMFNWKACVNFMISKWQPELPVKVEISSSDWEPGEVEIKKLKINIPKKIKVSQFFKEPAFRVDLSIPEQRVNIANGKIKFETPSIPVSYSATIIPSQNISLDDFFADLKSSIEANAKKGCKKGESETTTIPLDLDKAAEVFNFTVQQCYDVITLEGILEIIKTIIPIEQVVKLCGEIRNVPPAIMNAITITHTICDRLYGLTIPLVNIPDACKIYGGEKGTLGERIAIQTKLCEKFLDQGESLIKCAPGAAIITILDKAKEKCKGDVPDQMLENCKKVPLVTGQFPDLPAPTSTLEAIPINIKFECPSTKEAFSSALVGSLTNFLSNPTYKISLPDIIFPDIDLSKYNIDYSIFGLPVFYLHFPKIEIEDIILPDLELCDLSACKNIFPRISINPLIFKIPPIPAPAVELPYWMPQLRLKEIQVPTTQINFPHLTKIDLRDLISYETELKLNRPPPPNFHFSIGNLNWKRLILDGIVTLITYILNADLPLGYEMCIGQNQITSPLPIGFTFPNYYFSWGNIPQIPQIDFCKDINQFCQNVKNTLGTIVNDVNQIYQKNLVEKFDKFQKFLFTASDRIEEKTEKAIKEKIENYSTFVQKKVNEFNQQQNPPFVIPAWTTTTEIKWQDILNEIAQEEEFLKKENGDYWLYLNKTGKPIEIDILKIIGKKLGYKIPTVKLSEYIKMEKEKVFKLPFQLTDLSFGLNVFNQLRGCETTLKPKGKAVTNFEPIDFTEKKKEISSTTQKIVDILK